MRKKLLLLLLSPLFLPSLQAQREDSFSQEDAMVVNSGEAQYDGKEIVLVGQVDVQHTLGQITARRLAFIPIIHKDKKNKFGFLKISEHVQILLKDGGELYCQQAEVDFAKMQGVFVGNAADPDVIYLNRGEQKSATQKTRAPLEIKSMRMTFGLMREISSSSARILVKHIEAQESVRVHYNNDHVLLADHVVYQRIADEKSSLAGLLTLSVKDNLSACTMTNLNGDRLSAHVIQLSTIERKLYLSLPVGTLFMRREKQPAQVLEFSAQELVWDDLQNSLLLKGMVDVTQNQSLSVHTPHEIFISQTIVEGKKTLKSLRSPKNTQISYSDIKKDRVHKIYCPGSFVIDHERQEMTLQRGEDEINAESQKEQVYVEDDMGEMYADRVHIYYAWNDKQLVPEKIVLEGNVNLLNRFTGHRGESGSILHYALADQVEYFPAKHEMLLNSANGNRVLFLDKSNNVQMSAPSLRVLHDPVTRKESIQGLGDVRFTFIEKELEQLKSHFLLHKELQGAKSDKK